MSDLRNSTLRSADLHSADLTNADLRWSDLSDVNLDAGGGIVALSRDISPRRYLFLTRECGLGRIAVNSDGSLKFSYIPLSRTLRWPENLYVLAEDVVLIVGHSEFLIVEIGSGAAEEITHFRVSSNLRNVAILDQSLLGLLFESDSGSSEAILIDMANAEIVWRVWLESQAGVCAWSRDSFTVTSGSSIVIYMANGTGAEPVVRVMQTDFVISGRNLVFADREIVAVSDDGHVVSMQIDDSNSEISIQAHGGSGTAVIASNGDILSAGSDGSVALVRHNQDLGLEIISRLERRLRCSRAKIEGLKGARERDIFLVNGAEG